MILFNVLLDQVKKHQVLCKLLYATAIELL